MELLSKIAEGPWPYEWDLETHIHMAFLAGSRGWGLHNENSDYDVTVVVIPPAHAVLGLDPFVGWRKETWIEDMEVDINVWSITKFVSLLVKSNPTVSQLLWLAPDKVHSTVFGNNVLKHREKAITRRAIANLCHAAVGVSPVSPPKLTMEELDNPDFDFKSTLHGFRMLFLALDMAKEGKVCSTLEGSRARTLHRVLSGEFDKILCADFFSELLEQVDYALGSFSGPEEIDAKFFEQRLVETTRIFM